MFDSDSAENPNPQLLREIADFRSRRQSALMATVSTDGLPEASVVPCVFDDANDIYIYVSALSRHTSNLSATGRASVLFVEDEQGASNLFARKRLGYSCLCEKVEKDSAQDKRILGKFEARFGKFVQTLRALPDFSLFRLQPVSGSYVCGFGKAFNLEGENLLQIIHITPKNIRPAS